MQIIYELAREDYIEYTIFHTNYTTKKTKLIWDNLIKSLFFTFMMLYLYRFDMKIWVIFLLFMFYFLLSITLGNMIEKDFLEDRAKKAVDKGKNIGLFGEHSITLTEDFLINKNKHIEIKMDYSGVEQIVEAKEYIYILCKYSADAYIVPIWAFESMEQKTEFLDKLNALIEKSKIENKAAV